MSTEASKAKGVFQTTILHRIGRLGVAVWAQWDELRHAAAVIGTVLWVGVQPWSWGRTRRNLFARQILSVGAEPLGFVGALAVFVGISVVVQLTFWTGAAGQSQLLGPLLVTVVARELGPVLINLVVIIRSGSAMTTELGALTISGEVRALEARGGGQAVAEIPPATQRALTRSVAGLFVISAIVSLLTYM